MTAAGSMTQRAYLAILVALTGVPAVLARADCAREDVDAGLHTYSIESGGKARNYSLYVPKSYSPTQPAPLILDFHGSGSTPQQELALSGSGAASERHGFIVALPAAAVPMPAGGFTWNVPVDASHGDDAVFARDVIEHAAQRLCIDPQRVYTMGFSGGARISSLLACRLADRIAAFGAVGGLRAPAECPRPRPLIAFHGTADPINPYDGGGAEYWGYGVDEAVQGWVAANECRSTPERMAAAANVERLTYSGCGDNTEVVFYRMEGAGHVWPGTALALPVERFGPAQPGIDATGLMIEFFERHPLPH